MHIKNVRFVVAAIAFLAAYAVYMSRVNLSIAIIAMVEDHHAASQPTVLISDDQAAAIAAGDADIRAAESKPPPQVHISSSNNNNNNDNSNTTYRDPLTTIFPTSKKSVKAPLISREKFSWTQVSGRPS